ncbi:hypothetical protein T09_3707, partial [Trichinella sp. T9]
LRLSCPGSSLEGILELEEKRESRQRGAHPQSCQVS